MSLYHLTFVKSLNECLLIFLTTLPRIQLPLWRHKVRSLYINLLLLELMHVHERFSFSTRKCTQSVSSIYVLYYSLRCILLRYWSHCLFFMQITLPFLSSWVTIEFKFWIIHPEWYFVLVLLCSLLLPHSLISESIVKKQTLWINILSNRQNKFHSIYHNCRLFRTMKYNTIPYFLYRDKRQLPDQYSVHQKLIKHIKSKMFKFSY